MKRTIITKTTRSPFWPLFGISELIFARKSSLQLEKSTSIFPQILFSFFKKNQKFYIFSLMVFLLLCPVILLVCKPSLGSLPFSQQKNLTGSVELLFGRASDERAVAGGSPARLCAGHPPGWQAEGPEGKAWPSVPRPPKQATPGADEPHRGPCPRRPRPPPPRAPPCPDPRRVTTSGTGRGRQAGRGGPTRQRRLPPAGVQVRDWDTAAFPGGSVPYAAPRRHGLFPSEAGNRGAGGFGFKQGRGRALCRSSADRSGMHFPQDGPALNGLRPVSLEAEKQAKKGAWNRPGHRQKEEDPPPPTGPAKDGGWSQQDQTKKCAVDGIQPSEGHRVASSNKPAPFNSPPPEDPAAPAWPRGGHVRGGHVLPGGGGGGAPPPGGGGGPRGAGGGGGAAPARGVGLPAEASVHACPLGVGGGVFGSGGWVWSAGTGQHTHRRLGLGKGVGRFWMALG